MRRLSLMPELIHADLRLKMAEGNGRRRITQVGRPSGDEAGLQASAAAHGATADASKPVSQTATLDARHTPSMTRSHARFPTYLEDQREFFDSLITEDWDSYHSAAWDRTRRAEVAEIMRVAPARRVLDVGCGCGFHDVVIAEHPDIVEVVAVDYSPRSIEVAEREY